MNTDLRLFSCKMTHDTGFAPNPFHGYLSLATCKPNIRKYKKVGDWIAGFTSNVLNGGPMGQEKLIFLMKITERITYSEYWNNTTYAEKTPNSLSNINKVGDNIYGPSGNKENKDDIIRLGESIFHRDEENQRRDLRGENVLLSTDFYYFGGKPFEISNECRPAIPKGPSGHGVETKDHERVSQLIDFVKKNKRGKGLIFLPHAMFADKIKVCYTDCSNSENS